MLKERIKKELLEMGYNPIHLGTKYLVETIYLLHNNKQRDFFYLERDVYIKLSEKYGKNLQTIKSDVIKATKGITFKLKNLNNIKMTPKLVVEIVLDKIEE